MIYKLTLIEIKTVLVWTPNLKFKCDGIQLFEYIFLLSETR